MPFEDHPPTDSDAQPAHLLPPNATPLEKALNVAVLRQSARLPRHVARRLWNPDACPLELLPWLAWTVGLQTWSNEWPQSIKRARIREAIAVAKQKGTLASIERVVQSYGGNFIIKEWWQFNPPKTPHTFEITLVLSGQDGQAATADFFDTVLDDIRRTKPLRSHFTASQGLTTSGGIRGVVLTRAIVYMRSSATLS